MHPRHQRAPKMQGDRKTTEQLLHLNKKSLFQSLEKHHWVPALHVLATAKEGELMSSVRRYHSKNKEDFLNKQSLLQTDTKT